MTSGPLEADQLATTRATAIPICAFKRLCEDPNCFVLAEPSVRAIWVPVAGVRFGFRNRRAASGAFSNIQPLPSFNACRIVQDQLIDLMGIPDVDNARVHVIGVGSLVLVTVQNGLSLVPVARNYAD